MNLMTVLLVLCTAAPAARAFPGLEGLGQRQLHSVTHKLSLLSSKIRIMSKGRTGASKPFLLFAASDPSRDESNTELDAKPAQPRRPRVEEDVPVNVNVVENVDPVTLTVVGFALLAINFFVLANAGDGGIAGTVASIINLSRQ